MDLAGGLTRKLGPLPGWGYLVLGALAFLAYRLYRARQVNVSADTPSGQLTAANQSLLVSGLGSALAALALASSDRPAATGTTSPSSPAAVNPKPAVSSDAAIANFQYQQLQAAGLSAPAFLPPPPMLAAPVPSGSGSSVAILPLETFYRTTHTILR